mmetsp:Transcript_30622/g.97750  ORF Transcript_30622/g.97750 Transcript_30622/m.97750 type:complete len:113 (+) Transcript_30622:196-534(+)
MKCPFRPGEAVEALGLEGDAFCAYIANMAVDPENRRQGVARALLEACEVAALASTRDVRHQALMVYADNSPALELYEGAGFSELQSWEDPTWGAECEKGRICQKRLLLVRGL